VFLVALTVSFVIPLESQITGATWNIKVAYVVSPVINVTKIIGLPASKIV